MIGHEARLANGLDWTFRSGWLVLVVTCARRDPAVLAGGLRRSADLQRALWQHAIDAAREQPTPTVANIPRWTTRSTSRPSGRRTAWSA